VLRAILLALDNLKRRSGITTQHDSEDPDGAVADLKRLAMQYGERVPAGVYDIVLARPLGDLFHVYMPH